MSYFFAEAGPLWGKGVLACTVKQELHEEKSDIGGVWHEAQKAKSLKYKEHDAQQFFRSDAL